MELSWASIVLVGLAFILSKNQPGERRRWRRNALIVRRRPCRIAVPDCIALSIHRPIIPRRIPLDSKELLRFVGILRGGFHVEVVFAVLCSGPVGHNVFASQGRSQQPHGSPAAQLLLRTPAQPAPAPALTPPETGRPRPLRPSRIPSSLPPNRRPKPRPCIEWTAPCATETTETARPIWPPAWSLPSMIGPIPKLSPARRLGTVQHHSRRQGQDASRVQGPRHRQRGLEPRHLHSHASPNSNLRQRTARRTRNGCPILNRAISCV